MEGQEPIGSDKQGILPPQYSVGNAVYTGGQQMPGTHTIIHVNNSVAAPPDYFLFSLFVTICCCLPFGVVGLVKSSEVRTRAAMGDLQGAELSSAQAKKWSFAGLFTGIGIISLVIAIYVIVILVAVANAN